METILGFLYGMYTYSINSRPYAILKMKLLKLPFLGGGGGRGGCYQNCPLVEIVSHNIYPRKL